MSRPKCWVVDLLLHGDDVAAGRERTPGTGQDNDVDLGVVLHILPIWDIE
jgi:hypothetical protein